MPKGIPVYPTDVVITRPEVLGRQDQVRVDFALDTTAGGATVQVPFIGDDSGCQYRILSIHANLTVASNAFVRIRLIEPPFIILQDHTVYEAVIATAAAGIMWTLSDGGPGTSVTIAATTWKNDHFPSFWFDARLKLEITQANGDFGMWSILYEKVNKNGM